MFVVLAIALFNLALGWCLASHLGYGPPLPTGASWAKLRQLPLPSWRWPKLRRRTATATVDDSAALTPSADFPAPQPDRPADAGDTIRWAETYLDGWYRGRHAALATFRETLVGFLDPELHDHDDAMSRQALAELQTAVLAQIASLEASLADLADQDAKLGPYAALGDQFALGTEGVLPALVNLREALTGTPSDDDNLDACVSAARNGAQRLVERLHAFRDQLEEVRVALADRCGLLRERNAGDDRDPQLPLYSLLAFEARLDDIWHHQHEGLLLTAGLIDIDGCGLQNRYYGPLAIDHVLEGVAQWLVVQLGPERRLYRRAGQRFVVLFTGEAVAAAAEQLDSLRQQLMGKNWDVPGGKIEISLSSAAGEVHTGDDAFQLCDRLAAVLEPAKTAGRNQTFWQVGREAPQRWQLPEPAQPSPSDSANAPPAEAVLAAEGEISV